MSVDPDVYELALHFLEDDATPEMADSLAADIQEAIERWLENNEEAI